MADFITLACPSCGSRLQITNDIDRFACGYCGNEHIVRRSGGVVSLAPVMESLGRLERGVDKTASELAIVRVEKELEQLRGHLQWVHEQREPASKWPSLITGLGVVGCVVLLCSPAFPESASMELNVFQTIGGFFFYLCVAYFGFRRLQRQREQTATDEAKVDTVRQQIQQKEAELQQHLRIVNS